MQLEITRRYMFFLILIINILYSNCQSSFFMVHNIEKNEYYCITNSTYALSWLTDEEGAEESERISQFIPYSPLLQLDIEGNSKWTYKINQHNQGILDRRWESN
jgi:hypothetical protein